MGSMSEAYTLVPSSDGELIKISTWNKMHPSGLSHKIQLTSGKMFCAAINLKGSSLNEKN
jgi:hypothetical protein